MLIENFLLNFFFNPSINKIHIYSVLKLIFPAEIHHNKYFFDNLVRVFYSTSLNLPSSLSKSKWISWNSFAVCSTLYLYEFDANFRHKAQISIIVGVWRRHLLKSISLAGRAYLLRTYSRKCGIFNRKSMSFVVFDVFWTQNSFWFYSGRKDSFLYKISVCLYKMSVCEFSNLVWNFSRSKMQ